MFISNCSVPGIIVSSEVFLSKIASLYISRKSNLSSSSKNEYLLFGFNLSINLKADEYFSLNFFSSCCFFFLLLLVFLSVIYFM